MVRKNCVAGWNFAFALFGKRKNESNKITLKNFLYTFSHQYSTLLLLKNHAFVSGASNISGARQHHEFVNQETPQDFKEIYISG